MFKKGTHFQARILFVRHVNANLETQNKIFKENKGHFLNKMGFVHILDFFLQTFILREIAHQKSLLMIFPAI